MACFQYRNVYRGCMGAFLCRGAHAVLGFSNGNRLSPAHTFYRLYSTDEIGTSRGGSWIGDRPIHVLIGLVLPFWVVVGVFVNYGQLIANPILMPAILHTWEPGMSLFQQ